jgi:hypothetical protein
MNDRAKKLRDVLLDRNAMEIRHGEAYDGAAIAGFDMAKTRHYCGTPSCIKGFAEWLMNKDAAGKARERFSNKQVAEWLGLDINIALKLFYPGDLGPDAFDPWDEYTLARRETPWALRGADGAKFAAEALERACDPPEGSL